MQWAPAEMAFISASIWWLLLQDYPHIRIRKPPYLDFENTDNFNFHVDHFGQPWRLLSQRAEKRQRSLVHGRDDTPIQLHLEQPSRLGSTPILLLAILPVQIPPQNGDNPSAGSCGDDGKQFCPRPWPSSWVGIKPAAPPDIPNLDCNCTYGVSQNSTSQNSYGTDPTCLCKAPDEKIAQEYSKDPVFPPALCLTISRWKVASSLSGRSGKGTSQSRILLDGDGMPWNCLCNATYVSTACCKVIDGMVLEETAKRSVDLLSAEREGKSRFESDFMD